jgi:hypothetical protein
MVAALVLLAAGATIALSTWQAQLSRDSSGAHWCVALVGIGAVVMMIALGRGRQRQTSGAWAHKVADVGWRWRTQPTGIVVSGFVWGLLILGVVGWDLTSFGFQSPLLPTLSTFVGHVTRYRIGRGLVFASWLVVGWYLVAGGRTELPQ